MSNRYGVRQYVVRPPVYWLDETGEHTQVIKHIMPIDDRTSIRLSRRVMLASVAIVVVMTFVSMTLGSHRAIHVPDPPPAPGNILAIPPASQLTSDVARTTQAGGTDPTQATGTTAPKVPASGAASTLTAATLAADSSASGVSPAPSDVSALDQFIVPLTATNGTVSSSPTSQPSEQPSASQPAPSPPPPTYSPPPFTQPPSPDISPPASQPSNQGPPPHPSKKPHPPHPSKSPKK